MVARLIDSPVVVRFVGGPRDGKRKSYPHDPVLLGCKSDCIAKGVPLGVYRTSKLDATGDLLMVWKPTQGDEK